MRITIEHRLTLNAPSGTSQAMFHLLLTPPSGLTQTVESWSVEMAGIAQAGRFVDGFGNTAHLVNQPRPDGEITIEARGVVATRDTNGVLGRPPGEPVPALYRRLTPLTKTAPELVDGLKPTRSNRLDLLHGLMQRVGEKLGLPDEEAAPGQTQMQADGGQVQSQRQGDGATEDNARADAADYAHLFIGAARALHIPARFVTGYRLVDAPAPCNLHAWAEAFDESLGWIGFDPHQQICPTERYVRLAVGLDKDSAPALRTVPVVEIAQRAKLAVIPAAQ